MFETYIHQNQHLNPDEFLGILPTDIRQSTYHVFRNYHYRGKHYCEDVLITHLDDYVYILAYKNLVYKKTVKVPKAEYFSQRFQPYVTSMYHLTRRTKRLLETVNQMTHALEDAMC